MSDVERYVVTVKLEQQGLTEINELNNQLTLGGFTLTLTDDDGKVHELGPGNFGLIGTLDEQQVKELARGLGSVALGKEPEVAITRWEIWQKQKP